MRLSFLVESPVLYLAFFKTILAALFRAFGVPLSFLPSPWSFEQFGLWNRKKYEAGKYTRVHAPLARTYTNRIFESKDGTTSVKVVNYIERPNFCWNDLLTKSNRTEIQTYEVEERTFGTPCICWYTSCTRNDWKSHPTNVTTRRWLSQSVSSIFFSTGLGMFC